MKCGMCMWSIWEDGFGVVGCMACGDEECPTSEDLEAAEREGYLAFYG